MARVIAALLLMTTPALGWEAKSGQVCELTHDGAAARVEVTYDPMVRQYAISITPDQPWSEAAIFAIRFDGPRGRTISTDRHRIRGGTLTVTDRGFGNVLDGLEFNTTATAQLGDQTIAVELDDAGPAVRAFRACAAGTSI